MNIKLNPMPATPFEAVHAADDVLSWLGFINYVKHDHECRIDVMEHCDLQVVVDYANSQVVIVGFLDGMEIYYIVTGKQGIVTGKQIGRAHV